jgi:ribosomal-protein-alanine N-acetyltransferase
MNGSDVIQTARLLMRKPRAADAEAVFHRYASDPVATRYLSWPTHRSLVDTRAFLEWSDAEWAKWPVAGPYLVFARDDGHLLGGTGLSYKSPQSAVTGYVFAQDAWGQGFATESLQAMVDLTRQLGIQRLEAICHVEHRPSAHVLEKCGFQLEEIWRQHTEFPNLTLGVKSDVCSYVRTF